MGVNLKKVNINLEFVSERNIALNLSLLSSSTPMMCTASSDWSQELKHTLGKTSNEK